jgi:hypothetical protein
MPIQRQAFRARDVRANIKELGFEKGIELSLTLLADEMAGFRQSMKDMTELQSMMIDRFTDMTQVNGAMAQKISEMRRQEDQFDSVRGEGINPT